jgi:alkylhydroperoxidase family enzyme
VALADTVARMEWGECWLTPRPIPRELAAEVKRRTGGVVPIWVGRLASVPWVVRATSAVQDGVAHMPLALPTLIGFVVSQDNSCRYCYGVLRTILKVLGHADDQIDRIERDVHLSNLTPAEQAALAFARSVSHANPRPTAADVKVLADAGYEPAAIAEITFVTAFGGIPNRLATCFAIPPESIERWALNPIGRLLRPVLARKMRARRAPPEPLPQPNDGPFAAAVAALAGCPAARPVRQAIDEALASPILPRRTKLLMVAVVTRALGCERSTAEARRLLAAEGVGAAQVDEILANLGSASLDRREALLVPFARETVRYRAATIQQRTRELCEALTADEVIEAVGVAALANALGRLSVLLETC